MNPIYIAAALIGVGGLLIFVVIRILALREVRSIKQRLRFRPSPPKERYRLKPRKPTSD